MSKQMEVIRAWNESAPGDADAVAAFLSEDFENLDAEGNVTQSKAEYVGMVRKMYAS